MGNKESSSDKNIKEEYEITDKLGAGSFATVRRCKRLEDGKVGAVKIIRKKQLNKKDIDALKEELTIMGMLEHPNLVSLWKYYDTPKRLYIVMDILQGGELFDYIVQKQSLSEKESATIIRDVSKAVEHLHSKGIVHRDIKPENILFTDKTHSSVCLTDFGLAKVVITTKKDGTSQKKKMMQTACGTPGYVAPEILKQQDYGPQVDMWSVGVVLFIVLCGYPPFHHQNVRELYKKIKEGKFAFRSPYWDDVSDLAKDCITRLLVLDPRTRFTATQLLQHPWLSGSASDKVNKTGKGHMARANAMRQTQLARKLIKGVHMVMSVNTLLRAMMREVGFDMVIGQSKDGWKKLMPVKRDGDDAKAPEYSPEQRRKASMDDPNPSATFNVGDKIKVVGKCFNGETGVVRGHINGKIRISLEASFDPVDLQLLKPGKKKLRKQG